MTTLSNGNIEGPGVIEITPDPTRKALKMSVHFVTTHLQPQEVRHLILKMYQDGLGLYGPDWAIEIFNRIAEMPVIEPLEDKHAQ